MQHGDEADQAQDQIEKFQESAIAKARKEANRVETHPDFDGENCLTCGIEIPEARLKMGRIRCVDCQTQLEKLLKRGG